MTQLATHNSTEEPPMSAPTIEAPTGTLEHVAPGTLLLQRNIREAKPNKELVDSVRAVGVLEPITAVTTLDGLLVRFGHRRVLAALEAGLDTVPVYVTGADDLTNEAEVRRVISQFDENTQRQGLTAADEIGVVEQLVAFGLSADEITKQARVDRDDVDRAITVSKSKLARKATAKYEALTLDQVATVAEFEDDPEVAKSLIVTAIERPGQFPHVAQRARDDRARAEEIRKATETLTAKGIKVIDAPSHESRIKPLYHLVDDAGKDLTTRSHKSCPGHVAWFYGYRKDPEYGCSDPTKNGHKSKWGSSTSGTTAAADMTPEEREKAKKARRLVIENNKAWDSAQAVRRAWLADLAKRKAAHKGAAAFISRVIGAFPSQLGLAGKDLAAEWLGVTAGSYHSSGAADAADKATEGRALLIALVQVLAGMEAERNRLDWRRNGKDSEAGAYLRFLESIGYELSDVEKYAVSSKTGN